MSRELKTFCSEFECFKTLKNFALYISAENLETNRFKILKSNVLKISRFHRHCWLQNLAFLFLLFWANAKKFRTVKAYGVNILDGIRFEVQYLSSKINVMINPMVCQHAVFILATYIFWPYNVISVSVTAYERTKGIINQQTFKAKNKDTKRILTLFKAQPTGNHFYLSNRSQSIDFHSKSTVRCIFNLNWDHKCVDRFWKKFQTRSRYGYICLWTCFFNLQSKTFTYSLKILLHHLWLGPKFLGVSDSSLKTRLGVRFIQKVRNTTNIYSVSKFNETYPKLVDNKIYSKHRRASWQKGRGGGGWGVRETVSLHKKIKKRKFLGKNKSPECYLHMIYSSVWYSTYYI